MKSFAEFLTEDDKDIEKVSLNKTPKYKSNALVLKTIKFMFDVDLSDKITSEKSKYFSVDVDLDIEFKNSSPLVKWINKNYRVEPNGGMGWAVYNTKK